MKAEAGSTGPREPQRDPAEGERPRGAARKRRRVTEAIDTDLLTLGDSRIHEPQRLAVSRDGMVSTAHYGATAAGVEMLEAGGNAFDAAVAAAFALGVCEPAASGLGGQTMMFVHDATARRTFALDGSSRAPNRATTDAFADPRAAPTASRTDAARTTWTSAAPLSVLDERFTRTRDRVDAIGQTGAVGLLLQRNRVGLPDDIRRYRDERRAAFPSNPVPGTR